MEGIICLPPPIIRAGDFWWVWKELGKEGGFLSAKVVSKEDQMMPPVKGWTYFEGTWPSDPTMVCSRDLSPACGEIVVQLEGKAKELHSKFAGIYKPVKGKRQRGRWVGSYQRQSFAFYNCH